jgi:hypothetical protein
MNPKKNKGKQKDLYLTKATVLTMASASIAVRQWIPIALVMEA